MTTFAANLSKGTELFLKNENLPPRNSMIISFVQLNPA